MNIIANRQSPIPANLLWRCSGRWRSICRVITATCLLTLPPLASAADSNWYLGVHHSEVRVHQSLITPYTISALESIPPDGFEFKPGILRLGYQFDSLFGLELRYNFDEGEQDYRMTVVKPERINVRTTRLYTFRLEELHGLYGRLTFFRDKRFQPYLISGYTETKITNQRTGYFNILGVGDDVRRYPLSVIRTETTNYGFSTGLGANLHLRKNVDLNLEWMNWHANGALLQSSSDYKGFNAGLVFRF